MSRTDGKRTYWSVEVNMTEAEGQRMVVCGSWSALTSRMEIIGGYVIQVGTLV